jgi:thioredoxin-related protein
VKVIENMLTRAIWFLCGFVMAATLMPGSNGNTLYAANPAAEIRWRVCVPAAITESRETGKPLFWYFESESCVWCRRQLGELPAVAGIVNRDFVPVKGTAYSAAHYGVHTFPTIVIDDGKTAMRYDGYQDAAKLRAILSREKPGG